MNAIHPSILLQARQAVAPQSPTHGGATSPKDLREQLFDAAIAKDPREFLDFVKQHEKEIDTQGLKKATFHISDPALNFIGKQDLTPEQQDRLYKTNQSHEISTEFGVLDIIAARSGYHSEAMNAVKELGFKHSEQGIVRLVNISKGGVAGIKPPADLEGYISAVKPHSNQPYEPPPNKPVQSADCFDVQAEAKEIAIGTGQNHEGKKKPSKKELEEEAKKATKQITGMIGHLKPCPLGGHEPEAGAPIKPKPQLPEQGSVPPR